MLHEERLDVLGHAEDRVPLFLIERDRKAPNSVERSGPLGAHLQTQGARLALLEGFVLRTQAGEFGFEFLFFHGGF